MAEDEKTNMPQGPASEPVAAPACTAAELGVVEVAPAEMEAPAPVSADAEAPVPEAEDTAEAPAEASETPAGSPVAQELREEAAVAVAEAAEEAIEAGPEATEIEIPVETVNFEQFRNLLAQYYDGLARLIRLTKGKDETIAKLTREVQTYREDFALKLVKPLCASLIDLREDYRKTLRDVENYSKSTKDALKYAGYIKADLEETLLNQSVELDGDEFKYRGKSLLHAKPRKIEFAKPEVAAKEPQPEVSYFAGKPSFNELLRFIEYKNAGLEALLEENCAADAERAALESAVASLDDNYSDAILLPLYRQLVALYYETDGLLADMAETVSEENKAEKYAEILTNALEGIDKILFVSGVAILTEISDTLDSSRDKILKVYPTDDPAKDRKIARRYTDCYTYNGKVLYWSKVDVYKYNG